MGDVEAPAEAEIGLEPMPNPGAGAEVAASVVVGAPDGFIGAAPFAGMVGVGTLAAGGGALGPVKASAMPWWAFPACFALPWIKPERRSIRFGAS